jgi:hypothetical protein
MLLLSAYRRRAATINRWNTKNPFALRGKPLFPYYSCPSAKGQQTTLFSRRSTACRKDEAAEAATATKTEATKSVEPVSSKLTSADLNLSDEDFDLSHISAKEQTREEIIAAAEAAAFGDT